MGSNRFNFSMLALYFFCLCLWRLNGVDFVIPWPVPHYLDRMLLREHFFQSMLYLHMQPPLYNLILGMGIKLQAFAPLVSVETILFLFQTLCGGATIYYFAILSSSFIGNARCARICALIFTLNPALYLHLCAYYYTCFDAMLLLAAAWHLHRLHASGKLRHFLLTGAAVVLLANTHVLFHFVWATAVILGAGGIAWRRYPQKQALIALATVALLALVFAWPVKNKMLLGRFTASTWLGWNLSMDLPIELALISADPNSIPPRYRDVPAVANPYRSSGEPNANFYGFMIANDRNQALATQFLLHNPGYVGNKALLNYLYFCRNSARHSYFGSFEIFGQQPGRFLEAWLLAFERVFYLEWRNAEDLRAYRPSIGLVRKTPLQLYKVNGFTLAFPFLIFFSILFAWQHRKINPADAMLAASMLFCIVWVLLLVLFIDGTEGNRIRFATEPFVFLLVAKLIDIRRSRATPSAG